MSSKTLQKSPILPSIFGLPLKLVPESVSMSVFARALNALFKQEIADGELDFMEDKIVGIKVSDALLSFSFTLKSEQFVACHQRVKPDLVIEGSVYHFLLLASRREDPDTLFFNRKLKLSGDTELGLYVKNFLDAVDVTERWRHLHQLSDRASRIAERLG